MRAPRCMAALRRGLVTAAVLALSGAGLARATGAEAVQPTCTKMAVVSGGSPTAGRVRIPAWDGRSAYNCITGYGAAGPWVGALQLSLIRCEGFPLAVDGIYGPRTRESVRIVQKRARLSVDGIYGPRTRDAMRWYTDAGLCRLGTELGI